MPRKFRPVPLHLKQLRYGAQHSQYARFYGLYQTITGKKKRFSYVVKISQRLSERQVYRLMVVACGALLDSAIPEHKRGQVFSSFGELLRRTRWFRIRKIIRYKAGVIYER